MIVFDEASYGKANSFIGAILQWSYEEWIGFSWRMIYVCCMINMVGCSLIFWWYLAGDHRCTILTHISAFNHSIYEFLTTTTTRKTTNVRSNSWHRRCLGTRTWKSRLFSLHRPWYLYYISKVVSNWVTKGISITKRPVDWFWRSSSRK